MHRITMLGTGLIGMFYTMALHSHRRRDRVHCVYSRSAERVKKFAGEWDIPRHTTNMQEAIDDPETDVVVVGAPESSARRGGAGGGRGRQSGPGHQATGPQCGRGAADAAGW